VQDLPPALRCTYHAPTAGLPPPGSASTPKLGSFRRADHPGADPIGDRDGPPPGIGPRLDPTLQLIEPAVLVVQAHRAGPTRRPRPQRLHLRQQGPALLLERRRKRG